jgi:hypothetical protein
LSKPARITERVTWHIWQVLGDRRRTRLWLRIGRGIERRRGVVEIKFDCAPDLARIVACSAGENVHPSESEENHEKSKK